MGFRYSVALVHWICECIVNISWSISFSISKISVRLINVAQFWLLFWGVCVPHLLASIFSSFGIYCWIPQISRKKSSVGSINAVVMHVCK